MECGMYGSKKDWPRDLISRLAGAMFVGLGMLIVVRLGHTVHVARQEPTCADLGWAALSFIGLSAGCALLSIGAGIFRQVSLSARWSSPVVPVLDRLPPSPPRLI